jgi:hypothetical protein
MASDDENADKFLLAGDSLVDEDEEDDVVVDEFEVSLQSAGMYLLLSTL